MSIARGAVTRGQRGVAELMGRPPPMAGAPAGLFAPRLRRLAVAWIALSLPVVVGVAAVAATTPERYLVVFALVASGWYTTPALVFTYLAARRAPRPDAACWWLWLTALVVMYGIGCAMLIGAATGYAAAPGVGAAAVGVTALLVMAVVVRMVRTRSGRRTVTVDLAESLMSVVVIAAPVLILWGDDVVRADADWFAVPAALAAVAMVFGVYWAVLLFLRLRHDDGARGSGVVAVLLAAVGLVNAVVQAVHGVAGFALPSAPLLGLHGLCMGVMMLVPLYVPDSVGPGLDRLPPQDQVRGAWLPAAVVLGLLPVVVVVGIVERHRSSSAPVLALVAVGVIVALGVVRQLAAGRETHRLYAEVERAAEGRRELLAQIMQRTDEDRHRVAAQLHEQAVSAYASFVSYVQAQQDGPSGPGRGAARGAGASAKVRDELRAQAESLRQLMLAVRPLEVDRPRSSSLAAPIRAYVDGLYRDRLPPALDVTVADDVVLDWTTETIVLRIVQEAVRNVWRHGDATRIEVGVRGDGPAVEVSVRDDGVGFEPDAVLFESGIAAMRGFAGLGQGSLRIESGPGAGTRVIARLGDRGDPSEGETAAAPERAVAEGALRVSALRLVPGGAFSR